MTNIVNLDGGDQHLYGDGEAVSLLPCPFCGSTDINTEGPCYDQFMCNGCGVSQYDHAGHAEALAAWNRRSTDGEAVATGAKEKLRNAFAAWEREEGEAVEVIEAVSAYLSAPIEPVAVTDEMIERAAIGLFRHDYPADKWERFGQKDYHPEKYRAKARAALTAALQVKP